MGTSSSLFNQFLLQINDTNMVPELARNFITRFLEGLSRDSNDIAEYRPNPFYGWNEEGSLVDEAESLTLVDGGEDLQNIPLQPLIQPDREVDVIFAIDSSNDTPTRWPNGTALVATYERSLSSSGGNISNGTDFPAVPDANTFVNLGLNTRPTFFGCDSSNTSSITPLIVYIPNAPYAFHSNVSTFEANYNTSTRDAMLQNGYEVATMGNGTVDPKWPTCVGCAILSRSLERTNTEVPDDCRQCFERYCWDGTTNTTELESPYEPPYLSTPVMVEEENGASSERGLPRATVAGIMAIVGALLLF